jgi:hypothetical protein
MFIFFGDETAEKLKENYIILPLEKFEKDGKTMRAYCVVPGDKISIAELPNIPLYKNLHSQLIDKFEQQDFKTAKDTIELLLGKFGGELDSFYQEITKKLNSL